MTLKLYQVDAFADQLFSGNPAAVCPLNSWLPDAQLQAIAEENNLSETAFFVPIEGGYHLRWFTPTTEVRLCGHATLATAHVLFTELGFAGEQIDFQCRAGRLSVTRKGDRYEMDFPADKLEKIDVIPPVFEEALGIKELELYAGQDDFLAITDSEATIRAMKPDFRKVADIKGRGLIVSAPGEETDFVSRCFFPNYGIDEDPVTGSAHTTLSRYWSEKLGQNKLVGRQLSARQGTVYCEQRGERVLLGGRAVTYLEGRIKTG